MTDADPVEPEFSVVFERVLDRALAMGQVGEAMVRCGSRVGRAELRDRALCAARRIAAFADLEYRAYRGALAAACGGPGFGSDPGSDSGSGPGSDPGSGSGPRPGLPVGGLLRLLVTRGRPRSADAGRTEDDARAEVARARGAWELALLERGMLPFLLGRLEEAHMAACLEARGRARTGDQSRELPNRMR
ncbi:hypothetical protein [Streptomyces sp. NPDC127190]|uniref:hypothetical protein n=1 Tax=unclassified Streptomyces TaxID=2593676 RepID=UPI00362908C5